MKRNYFKRMMAVVLSAVVMSVGYVPVSAAKISDSNTSSRNASLDIELTQEYDNEYKVILKSKNLKTKKTQTVTTRNLYNSLKFNNNTWYKTSLTSYTSANKKVKTRNYYLAKSPKMNKVKLYGTSKMKVTWPKTYGATGYYVYMRKGSSGSFKKVKTTTSNSYITGTLSKYTNYYFYVRSYKKVSGTTWTSAKPTDAVGGYIYTKYY